MIATATSMKFALAKIARQPPAEFSNVPLEHAQATIREMRRIAAEALGLCQECYGEGVEPRNPRARVKCLPCGGRGNV